MKMRAVSVFLVLAVLVCTFSSCSLGAKVKINGVKIDNEVYLYFEDKLKDNSEETVPESDIVSEIIRYTTVNSEFYNRGLTLSSAQKAELSEYVNNIWHLYGLYYENLGITKQTVYKIEQSKQFETSLLEYYYSENGVSPVNEEDIKAFFSSNYVSVRFITGYLFNVDETGAAVPMTDDKRANAIESFNSAASMVNGGTSIEEVAGTLGENAEINDGIVSAFSNGELPDGFFEAAKGIENGKASAVALDSYVFLVQQTDLYSEDYGYYATYRTECLERMKGEEFSAVIDEWTKSYSAAF